MNIVTFITSSALLLYFIVTSLYIIFYYNGQINVLHKGDIN